MRAAEHLPDIGRSVGTKRFAQEGYEIEGSDPGSPVGIVGITSGGAVPGQDPER